MIRTKVDRERAIDEPYLIWNGFCDVVALSEYEDLSLVQRIAHLAFWYYNEVLNGGHFQYFENRRLRHIDETLDALRALGADRQHDILRQAVDICIQTRQLDTPVQTVEEYCGRALEGDYDALDKAFYAVYDDGADLNELLEPYLDAHVDDFIEFV